VHRFDSCRGRTDVPRVRRAKDGTAENRGRTDVPRSATAMEGVPSRRPRAHGCALLCG
jgi:hypothetical protein